MNRIRSYYRNIASFCWLLKIHEIFTTLVGNKSTSALLNEINYLLCMYLFYTEL